ncbi:MAG: cytochrome c [Chloroflexi bacterium]|nr:cytochrome c [Chloroflexota bacterium]MBI3930695.1 cytochrome c [Chloroflexota bacterium]
MSSKKTKRTPSILLAIFSVAVIPALLLAACGKATPVTTPPPPPPTTAPQIEGKALYTAKCAVCHGPNAEGTAAGPPIAGHSLSAVKMQVRNPMGNMPAFSPAQLGDSDLNEIAEFIASLGMAKAPVPEWEKQTTETMHHWMALLAIKGGDAADARHHLQDALTLIQEPVKKTEMEKALNMMAQGNMHDAEHEIEEMAGAESPSGITRQRFHLILAQRDVEAENATGVKHHLDHFIVKATEAEKRIAQEALELVEKGDFHEAEHEIEELLNM